MQSENLTGAIVNRRRRQGFILLEVVFAAALVAIGMFALIESLSRCLAAARSVQNYSTVQILLANKSYEFRVERPQDYLDQDGKFEDYPEFSWERKFIPTDTEGLYQHVITVYWRERNKLVSDSVYEYRYLPQKQR
jgi:Tfp pilus assembly protein PilV